MGPRTRQLSLANQSLRSSLLATFVIAFLPLVTEDFGFSFEVFSGPAVCTAGDGLTRLKMIHAS